MKSSTLGMEEVIVGVGGRDDECVVGRDGVALGGTLSPGGIVGLLVCVGGWEGRRVACGISLLY